MATFRGLRLSLPKPKTFMGIMSIQTATEMISLALLINKVTGLYGLLAILTGYALDAIQLSMYIYSVVVLVTLAFLLPHIRRQSPFQNLSLAWLYIFDTAANAAYTAFFAVEWYMASDKGNPAGDAVEQATDTAASIVLVVALTVIRVYLMFVVMSFTRQVMKRYMDGLANNSDKVGGSSRSAVQPFAPGTLEGEGWKGKLGRAMVSVGREYWIGGKEDEEWASADPARVPLAGAIDDGEE